jgi:hypothetical protein
MTCRERQAGGLCKNVDGVSRARTGDLLAASQTLSQLSYGPTGDSKSSLSTAGLP